jgi:hypothetical protein
MNLSEVCPRPSSTEPLRVDAGEFPFSIHDDCRSWMSAFASSIEAMCAWPASQPDRLLNLGSWSSARNAAQERTS